MMMRRNLEGIVDGEGIKRGDFTEIGVKIAAPIVVGGVVGGKTSIESLKTLGGIPEVEISVTTSTIVKQGKIVETEGKFLSREKLLVELLAKEGKTVEKLPENHALPGRKADAKVDGIITEFKKLDEGATNATVKSNISRSVKKGGQARSIIIDARGTGLTEAEAQRGLARASGITKGRVDDVRVIGDGFDITATNFR